MLYLARMRGKVDCAVFARCPASQERAICSHEIAIVVDNHNGGTSSGVDHSAENTLSRKMAEELTERSWWVKHDESDMTTAGREKAKGRK